MFYRDSFVTVSLEDYSIELYSYMTRHPHEKLFPCIHSNRTKPSQLPAMVLHKDDDGQTARFREVGKGGWQGPPSVFINTENKCVLTSAQSWFDKVVLDGVLLSPHLPVSMNLGGSGSNTRVELRAS